MPAMSAALTPSEYRLLVENSPVLVWRAGRDAKRDYVNDTWLAFTGRTLAQETGEGWAAGVHPDDVQRCVAYHLEHFQRREPFEMEYRLRRHDGVYRWIFERGVPYNDDRGELAGFIGSCVDIDERRRAESAREKADRELEQLAVTIVSHDIRGPLGAIDGAAKLIAMRATEDPKIAANIGRIERGVVRITSMVNDVVDLSRGRHGGGVPITRAPAELGAIARQVVDEVRAGVTDRPLQIECPAPVKGEWDAQRVTQAVSNLVGNAAKHGTAGQPVTVRVTAGAGEASVEVHNHGAIAPAMMASLFEPFAARAIPGHHKTGLGLGLFIARSIAHAHGGDLLVESTPERGTTFRLVLPLT
jgi:PAS domain S-box-containing protein